MNILAEMALRRARGWLKSVQSRTAAKVPAKITNSCTTVAVSEIVVAGPINRYMFLQGRSWAIDLVASLRATPIQVVVERLISASVGKPGSYVAGIEHVINVLKAADARDRRENDNLTHQAGRKE